MFPPNFNLIFPTVVEPLGQTHKLEEKSKEIKRVIRAYSLAVASILTTFCVSPSCSF